MRHTEIRLAISRTSRFPAQRIAKVPAGALRALLAERDVLHNTLATIAEATTHPGDSTADKKLGAAISMACLAIKQEEP